MSMSDTFLPSRLKRYQFFERDGNRKLSACEGTHQLFSPCTRKRSFCRSVSYCKSSAVVCDAGRIFIFGFTAAVFRQPKLFCVGFHGENILSQCARASADVQKFNHGHHTSVENKTAASLTGV